MLREVDVLTGRCLDKLNFKQVDVQIGRSLNMSNVQTGRIFKQVNLLDMSMFRLVDVKKDRCSDMLMFR